jgi:hypothetical protein
LYTGTNVPVNFRVFDGDSTTASPTPESGWYGDNVGSLSVDIYPCISNIKYVTGGGNLKFGKTIFWTFGGNVWQTGTGNPVGNFELVDHSTNTNYHFDHFANFTVSGATATFDATGLTQGKTKTPVSAHFVITDKGEPGINNDTIVVSIGSPAVLTTLNGAITGGNFQVFSK